MQRYRSICRLSKKLLEDKMMNTTKNVLIVGANFENKGAQSMLFVTVDELKKRIPECTVYFASYEAFDESKYAFKKVFYSEDAKNIALGKNSTKLRIKCTVKDVIKFVIGKHNNLFRFNELNKIIKKIDLIIDVSGFNVGKQWSTQIQEAYLNNIRIAKKFNIPMIMMPQSFGPFDYPENKQFLLKEIEELLRYPKIIFAREIEGYQSLIREFKLGNVRLSMDMVLQSGGVDINNIYRVPQLLKCETNLPQIHANSVAVIPNAKCFSHGDKDKIIRIYEELITYLTTAGKKVYILRHSEKDAAVCQLLADIFSNNINVQLLEEELSCIEYDELVKKFDFILCSRYHGAVHAYRNGIPCVLLGWADKYKELAHNLNQDQFVFDLTDLAVGAEEIKKALTVLIENREAESTIIKERIAEIQKDNCFDAISLQWE